MSVANAREKQVRSPLQSPHKQQRVSRLFFDDLPLDLCVRIVSMLYDPTLYRSPAENGLPLIVVREKGVPIAAVSCRMRQAVLLAIESEVDLRWIYPSACRYPSNNIWSLNIIRTQLLLFGDDLKRVKFDGSFPFETWNNATLTSTSDLANMKDLSEDVSRRLTDQAASNGLMDGRYPGDSVWYKAVSACLHHCTNLESFCVVLYDNKPIPALLETISRLNLSELIVECRCNGRRYMPRWFVPACYNRVREEKSFLQGLRSLDVKCCAKRNKNATVTYDLICSLASLRTVTLHHKEITKLPPHIENVRIATGDLKQAEGFGSAVTMFSSKSVLEEADLRRLHSCPNIEELKIRLSPGAEHAFPEKLSSLQSLSLSWRQAHNMDNYCTERNFLLGIVKRNLALRRIHFVPITIDLNEVMNIMKAMGPQLRGFKIRLSDNSLESLQDWVDVHHTAGRHNHDLRELLVYFPDIERDIDGAALRPLFLSASAVALAELQKRIKNALIAVKRGAPLLTSGSICSLNYVERKVNDGRAGYYTSLPGWELEGWEGDLRAQ